MLTLSEIYNTVTKHHTSDKFEALVVTGILCDVDFISEMRRERLVGADGIVPGIIWTVLVPVVFVAMGFRATVQAEHSDERSPVRTSQILSSE